MTPPAALVTGGAGFIGSHLVDRLLRDGHEVSVIDNLATGRLQNLAHHAGNPRLRVVRGDVNDPHAIDDAIRGCAWVFHLAALADIVPSIERPLDYHRANVDGTVSVIPRGDFVTAEVDRIRVVDVDAADLTKDASGLLARTDGQPAEDMETPVLVSGYLEASNVGAIDQLVATMSLNRLFETQVKMMKAAEDLSEAGNRMIRGS